MSWLRKYWLEELSAIWEQTQPPKGDPEHPIWVSPDWPPHSDLDLAIYEIKQSEGLYKELRIQRLKKIYGYEAVTLVLDKLTGKNV